MKTRYAVLLTALALAIPATPVVANEFVDGDDISDNTVQATDLGANVTRVKVHNLTVKPSYDVYAECYGANSEYYDEETGEAITPPDGECPVLREGAGERRVALTCGSGNVASGSVRDPYDALTILESFPRDDDTWVFVLGNTSANDAPAQLRLVCI